METNKMRDISREQFQKWHSTKHGWPISNYEFYWNDNYYEDEDFQLAWDAWQASREAVVVELPSACTYEGLTEHLGSVIELTYEAPEHDPVGLARLPDVRAAIEAQGLKVAGNHSPPNN